MEYINEKPEKKFDIIPILIILALYVVEGIAAAIAAAIVTENNEMFFSITWFSSKIVPLVIAIAIYYAHIGKDGKKVTQNFGGFILFSLVAFFVFYLVESGISYYGDAIDKWFGVGETTNQEIINGYFKSSSKVIHYVLLFFTTVILAPFLEEFEFRKLIFDAFPNTHFIFPVITSSILFGLLHMAEFSLIELLYLPIYAIPGFILALIYHYSGKNIFASYLTHSLVNLLSYIVIMSEFA
ncbi:CPBP family intramembrane metalloprotease [bacterium]|nr:CPBP family intramembrane metalloprotease [bacterium]